MIYCKSQYLWYHPLIFTIKSTNKFFFSYFILLLFYLLILLESVWIHLDPFGPMTENEVINRYCSQKMLKVIIIYNEMSGAAAESSEHIAWLIRFSEEDTNEEMVFPHVFEVVPKSQTRLIIFIYNQLSCSWGSNTI